MIWPIDETKAPVELVVTPNYHGGSPRGYLVVQASGFYGWWQETRPDTFCVRAPDGGGAGEWLELCFESALDDENGAVLGAAQGEWVLGAAWPAKTCLRGERVEAGWSRTYENGQVTVRLVFTPDALSFSVLFYVAALKTVRRCILAAGTRVACDSVFDPQPAAHGVFRHAPHALKRHGNLWFSPAPFAACFRQNLESQTSWAMAAIETEPENLQFCGFGAVSRPDGTLEFELDYPSLPPFAGRFLAPELVWRFGFESPFAALEGHANGLVAAGLAAPVERQPQEWWSGTMVCGWHRQVELASHSKEAPQSSELSAGFATGAAQSQDFARQDIYEEHVALYEKLGIPFDILTIDAEWTVASGDWRVDTQKWPDMKAFIRAQHQKGRRVLLWICPLSQGLPDEERDYSPDSAWGKVNPLNSAWRQRLQQRLKEMLGPDGLNADGLKFDYVGPMSGADWSREEPFLHGYTYLWELYRAVSAAAKAVRPDCLLDFSVRAPTICGLP